MNAGVVRFEEVSKRFRRGRARRPLRDRAVRLLRRLRHGADAVADDGAFWALKDVSFESRRGEALGIIGPNGAGKSTALKLMARILRPDEGQVHVTGRLAALIEVGAGFHGDLTGRENVYLHGAILGMSRRQVRAKFDDIVSFAGVEAFIDTPVKRYSSGMYARLGFSVAAHVEPDVLLVDEVLSVGDAMFRLRCVERMHELLRGGAALVLVTHHLDQMHAVCSRAVVLEQGRVSCAGTTEDAAAAYQRAMSRTKAAHAPDAPTGASAVCGVEVRSVRFLDASGRETICASPRQPLTVEVTLNVSAAIPRCVLELNMRRRVQENLLSFNSGRSGRTFKLQPGRHVVALNLDRLSVCGGEYFWNVRIWDGERATCELDTAFSTPLLVAADAVSTGQWCVDHAWGHESVPTVDLEAGMTRGSQIEFQAGIAGSGLCRAER